MEPRSLIGAVVLGFCTVTGIAQDGPHLRYIIKRSEVESGNLKIVYKDEQGKVQPLRMCYLKMIAEDISIQGGVPVFHFEKVASTKYDSIPDCISNNTPMGSFELDVRKRRIGDRNTSARIPFHGATWGISIIPYRIRFPQADVPISAESKIDFSFMYGFTKGVVKITHERMVHSYFTVSAFAGATSASLKSGTVTNPQQLHADRNNVAIAYGSNLMWGRNNFGISLSLGFDLALGEGSSLWIYQNQPWLGIGVSSNLGIIK